MENGYCPKGRRQLGLWRYTPLPGERCNCFFSRVIKKENDRYFLVTPVEKLGIQVEHLPFVIIDFERVEYQGRPTYQFIDNCDNRVLLTGQSQWQLNAFQKLMLPSICIRPKSFRQFQSRLLLSLN